MRFRACRPASPKTVTSTALEVKEVNDVDTQDRHRPRDGRRPLRLPPHDLGDARRSTTSTRSGIEPAVARFSSTRRHAWPVHEVGRNADFFGPDSARLLRANSSIVSDSVHLHSNGRDTKAHLEIGFKFAPKDYKPKYQAAFVALGNGVDIDIEANAGRPAAARVHRAPATTSRSCRSSRTCTRPACGCVSKRSGATTSRR